MAENHPMKFAHRNSQTWLARSPGMASKKDDKPKGVNVTIPSGPVGRAIDVVTDMFRPFS